MILRSLAALALACLAAPAFAASSRCVDISFPKSATAAHDGRWIELTADQWQFLRGIYAMNPETPAGLPYGDKAVLAQVDGNTGGLVFFIDGDKACSPMPVPKEIVDMIAAIGRADIRHEEGDGL